MVVQVPTETMPLRQHEQRTTLAIDSISTTQVQTSTVVDYNVQLVTQKLLERLRGFSLLLAQRADTSYVATVEYHPLRGYLVEFHLASPMAHSHY